MTEPVRGRTALVVALCGLVIVVDGYDMVMYGSVVPGLAADPQWRMSIGTSGTIASLALVGMLVGAIVAGMLADRWGRRRVLIAGLAWLSVTMLGCALAPTPLLFGLSRSLCGLGMGALFPTVTALLRETVRPRRATLLSTLPLCGIFVGGIVASVLAVPLVGGGHWRTMFWIGAAAVVLVPVVAVLLPESGAWSGSARRAAGLRLLFGVPYRRVTVPAWPLLFCSLLLNFGMLTFLPTALIRMGYPPATALGYGVVINVAAAVGGLAAGWFADRAGSRVVMVLLFAVGVVGLLALAATGPGAWWATAVVAVAGLGTLGTQMLATICVGALYPTRYRASGLGWGLGVGRLGGIVAPAASAALLGSVLPPQTLLVFFAVVAVLGLVAAALLGRPVPEPSDDGVAAHVGGDAVFR